MGNYGALTKEVFNTVNEIRQAKDNDGKPLMDRIFPPTKKESGTSGQVQPPRETATP